MRLLLTGVTGFLGSRAVAVLRERHTVVTLPSALVRGDLTPARLDALRAALAEQLRGDPEQAKQLLRANTDAAAARGVFGVPAFEADGRLFWGHDSLPMLRASLLGDAWFAQHWEAAASVEQGLGG